MKRIITLFSALIIIVFQTVPAFAEETPSLEDAIASVTAWQESTIGDMSVVSSKAGENVCDWLIFSVGRMGGSGCENGKDAAERYFRENRDTLTAADLERLSLAAAACGADISSNGMLDAALDGFTDENLSEKLINQLIFTLHTLDCGLYEIPQDMKLTRRALIDEILSRQLESGALYMMNENTPETDITAMAVSALAPYAPGDAAVSESVQRMLDFLSSQLTDECTVKNWGAPSCETTAQTIAALCAAGVDLRIDERFTRNGMTLLDGLMSYRQSDGGYAHNADSKGSDAYATTQALYAMIAEVRFENGRRALFDMRNEQTEELSRTIRSIGSRIAALETSDTASAEALMKEYAALPVSERMYVSNYDKLQTITSDYAAAFSPDDIATNEGVCVSGIIFAQTDLSAQTLTAASGDVSALPAPSSSAAPARRRSAPMAETAILITIGTAALLAIVLNHTVFKNKTTGK